MNKLIIACSVVVFIGVGVAGYIENIPVFRNDVQKAAFTGELDPTTAYLMSLPPIDPDAYIYVGPGVVKYMGR